MSTDGMVWTQGVGSYGDGWGNAGNGVSVREGDTLYIKFHSDVPGAGLFFAEHGRRWGEWDRTGPVLGDGIGRHPNEPVILRISDVGTPGSTVTWVNGRGKSGIWSGLRTTGPYDLALHADARWTLPPVVVTRAPRRSLWATLLGSRPAGPSPSPDPIHTVPEGGATWVLATFALLLLPFLRRMRT